MTKKLWKEFLQTLIHPFDTFEEMRYKKTGSAVISAIFIVLLFIVTIAERQLLAFRFNHYSVENTNSLLVFASTSLMIVVAAIVNWSISTLWDGKASFRLIFIVFGYSLCPYIVGVVAKIVASQFLTLEETAFLNFLLIGGAVWSGLMIWFGQMQTQEYTISKTIMCLLLTIVGIVLAIALVFLIILLFQQLFSFVASLINEAMQHFG